MDPYFGVEFQWHWAKGNKDWDNFLPQDYNQYGIFLGNKYHPNFGFELGYYKTFSAAGKYNATTHFNGQPSNGLTETHFNIKRSGFTLDFDIYKEFDKEFNGYLIIGLATVHTQVDIAILDQIATDLGTSLKTITGKNRAVFRLGLGVEYIQERWGARARLVWEANSNERFNVDNVASNFTITDKPYINGTTFNVGIFVRM